MKRFVWPIIIGIVVILILVVIKIVDFGALTIAILERSAHIDVKYESIQGGIFKGFRLQNYKIKLSETDSIYGEFAQFGYHFNPFKFSLPNLFEINLIEPIINIKKTSTTGASAGFKYPRLNLSLRINLKNGKIIYEDKKTYIIERLTGLIFVDFVGTKLYLSTMNLSFTNPDYPIFVTSANLSSVISSQGIKGKAIKIKGRGFIIETEVDYSPQDSRLAFKFHNSRIDLDEMGIYKGRINFWGDVEYAKGSFKPNLQGIGQGFYPVDSFKFETNHFADTVVINLFDGELLQGNFFAQVKFVSLKDWALETNFKDLNLAKLVHIEQPMYFSGYLGYREKKFTCFINSPKEDGLAMDSCYIFGAKKNSGIYLDSLFIKESGKILLARGDAYPKCSLNVILNNFDIERIYRYFPIKGKLSGLCHLKGDMKNLNTITFTTDISGNDFAIGNFILKEWVLKTKNFNSQNPVEYLSAKLKTLSYKNYYLDSTILLIENGNFSLKANKNKDSLAIKGNLGQIGQGTINSIFIEYNGVETKNIAPISFDLNNRKIGEFSLKLFDGALTGTLAPRNVSLTDANLEKLARVLGLREKLTGRLKLNFTENYFSLDAQDVNFIGLKNGSVTTQGEYKNNVINIKSLAIVDENNQELHCTGVFSFKESKLDVKFNNVRTWIFPFLNNFLQKPDGVMSGDIKFSGNLEDFKLFGKGEISNGSFGIKNIGVKFDSVQTNVQFDEQRIIFESAKGKIFSNGDVKSSAVVTSGGVVKLSPRFRVKNLNFDFSFHDAPIQFLPFAYGKGSGNFSVGMKNEVMFYNGNITVKEGIVPIDFGLEVEEESGRENNNWRMYLKISGERNIWLRNREADIEFGGDLYVIKEQEPLYLSGILTTKRGNFYWLNHTLKITNGQVTFMPKEEIDPELDIWAELDTREKDPNTGNEIKIKLHCFGTLSEPIFEFFTEPEGMYTEQDIITYLNLNITWRELESMKQGEYVGKVLPKSLLAWLESDVSRRIRAYTGLDYFRIEAPFFEPEEKTKLTVGKYISRDLFITYTYDITTFSNEFNVEYFIDDKNEILIRKDEQGEYSLEYQYRIRF